MTEEQTENMQTVREMGQHATCADVETEIKFVAIHGMQNM